MRCERIKVLIPYYVVGILLTIAGLLSPYLESRIVDALVYLRDYGIFYRYLFMLLAVAAFQLFLHYISEYYKLPHHYVVRCIFTDFHPDAEVPSVRTYYGKD